MREAMRTAKDKRQGAELMTQARAAAERDEFWKADELYLRAKDLDPSVSIDKEMQDMHARRLRIAQKTCTSAEARWVMRPTDDARRLYADALRLLRPGEPCYDDALQRSK